MTLRAVAEAFFGGDAVLARSALRQLESDDLIEAEPIYRTALDQSPKGARVWRVLDPK